MADQTSREKVQALVKEDKSAKEIAEALGMSQANVYAHIRKIKAEAGEKPRGRGRPPKVQTEGNGDTPKAEAPKASRPAPGKAKATPSKASTNGHDAAEFPHLLEALDNDLAEARNRVTKLERMRAALVG